MPSSSVRTFTDPDEYAEAFREAEVALTVTERGRFVAKYTKIDLHQLSLQRFSDNLPRIAHSALASGRAMFSFLTQQGPLQLSSGMEMKPSSIVRHGEGRTNILRSSGLACYGTLSLPLDQIAYIGELLGSDLTPPLDVFTVIPSPDAMAKLQRLHATAGDLAEYAPKVLAHSEGRAVSGRP
jgi:hypothetical protein